MSTVRTDCHRGNTPNAHLQAQRPCKRKSRFHIHQPLFQCCYCTYSSTYHLSNVRKHIMDIHESQVSRLSQNFLYQEQPISLKTFFREEIESFLYMCFSDPKMLSRVDPHLVSCMWAVLDTVCCDVSRAAFPSCSLPLTGSCRRRHSLTEGDSVGKGKAREKCRLCNLAVDSHLERHVRQVLCYLLSNSAASHPSGHVRVFLLQLCVHLLD